MTLRRTRVTSKGQVTIPKELREQLGIEGGDAVLFVREGARAYLTPAKAPPLETLRGALASREPFPGTDEIRQEVMRHVADQALGREHGRQTRKSPRQP